MECIRGKRSLYLDRSAVLELVAPYHEVHVDLGTGDGRYVLQTARDRPDWFVIGVDACRENLQRSSRHTPQNALFVIANVLFLPAEIAGIASMINIAFPWGSLLQGLLDADRRLLDGVHGLSSSDVCLEVLLNAGAVEEQGCLLDPGAERIRSVLREDGFTVGRARSLDAAALRQLPSTWARRLANGRDPRATAFTARRCEPSAAIRCVPALLERPRSLRA